MFTFLEGTAALYCVYLNKYDLDRAPVGPGQKKHFPVLLLQGAAALTAEVWREPICCKHPTVTIWKQQKLHIFVILCHLNLTQNVFVNATRCMSGVAKDGFAKVLSVGDADAENELNEVFFIHSYLLKTKMAVLHL